MRPYTAAEEIAARLSVANNADTSRSLVEERFDRLLALNGPALVRLAASYTNTAADRDDLFQEIVLALWRALAGFRGECSERTFLFRIAHNRGMAHLSKRSKPSASADDGLLLPDPRPGPEQELAQEQERERLLYAIRQLPLLYRQVITLALEGFSYSEIAEVAGVTENNVGVRLNRARQLLRDLMEIPK